MAKKTLEELTGEFNLIVGDNDSEEVLAFLEDLTDTMNAEPPAESEDLRGRVEELEGQLRDLRKRYRDRFYGRTDEKEEEESGGTEKVDGDNIKIKDLFKEEKESCPIDRISSPIPTYQETLLTQS